MSPTEQLSMLSLNQSPIIIATRWSIRHKDPTIFFLVHSEQPRLTPSANESEDYPLSDQSEGRKLSAWCWCTIGTQEVLHEASYSCTQTKTMPGCPWHWWTPGGFRLSIHCQHTLREWVESSAKMWKIFRMKYSKKKDLETKDIRTSCKEDVPKNTYRHMYVKPIHWKVDLQTSSNK